VEKDAKHLIIALVQWFSTFFGPWTSF